MRRPVLPTLLALSLTLALPLHAEETTPTEPPAEPAASEAPAPAEVPRVPLEERSQDSAAALERQLPKGEQQMLQAGDDTQSLIERADACLYAAKRNGRNQLQRWPVAALARD